jgi:hypothetical protein
MDCYSLSTRVRLALKLVDSEIAANVTFASLALVLPLQFVVSGLTQATWYLGTSQGARPRRAAAVINACKVVTPLKHSSSVTDDLRCKAVRREIWRMASSGMLRRVALVITDVSEERSASIIRVTRIGELGTTLADA